MKAAKVVDPAAPDRRDQVRFGATVELADEEDERRTITLVGDDEADATAGRIGWSAPLARALVGAKVGDERSRAAARRAKKATRSIAIRYPGARLARPERRPACGGSAGIAFGPGVGDRRQRRERGRLLVVAVDHPPRRPARIGIGAEFAKRLGIAGLVGR